MPRYTPRLRPPHTSNLPMGLKFKLIEAPREGNWNSNIPVSKHRYGVIETEAPIEPALLDHFDLIPIDESTHKPCGFHTDVETENQMIRKGITGNASTPINDASGADPRLPEFCATRLNTDNSPIILRRGETGYWPGSYLSIVDDEDIAHFNEKHGASAGAVKAMEFGSMFGWHTPGAKLEAGEDMVRRSTTADGEKA